MQEYALSEEKKDILMVFGTAIIILRFSGNNIHTQSGAFHCQNTDGNFSNSSPERELENFPPNFGEELYKKKTNYFTIMSHKGIFKNSNGTF